MADSRSSKEGSADVGHGSATGSSSPTDDSSHSSPSKDSPGTSEKGEATVTAVAGVTEKLPSMSLSSQDNLQSNSRRLLSETTSIWQNINPFQEKDGSKKNAKISGSKVAWPNSADDYEVKEVIGVGATAVVHAAYCKPRDEKCAIKRINLEKWNTSMDELLKEIQAMSSCNHENVVSYFTSFVYKEELWLVLRLLSSGSLLDIIRHKMKTQDCKHGVLDEAAIATVLREVLKGLEYLHQNGHIHRDIKAGNILLGSEGQVQIADFGVSAWLASGGDSSRAKSRHTFVGTPCWMAPEVMEQVKGYDYKADIWSFGITAIELATGTAPYHKYPPMKVLMLTLQNDPPILDSGAEDKEQYKQGYGTRFRKMISECLQKDPSKRPTASELLKNPFFKNKAKDKKYLQQHLVASAPNIDTRVQKAKTAKRPGTSGRLHRNEVGEWVWSSDEDEGDSGKQKKKVTTPLQSENDDELEDIEDARRNYLEERKNKYNIKYSQATQFQSLDPISIEIKMRNHKTELHDISFEYDPLKDTTIAIANELYSNHYIVQDDVLIIASNMRRLIENPPPDGKIRFRVSTGFNYRYVPDESQLIGYAQIKLTD